MTEKPTYEELEQRVKDLEEENFELLKGASEINPEIILEDIDLKSILNIDEIQSILDDFHYLTNMVTAVLDTKGEVIESTGWQDICTKFHRIHPETAHNCTESDLYLSKNLKPGEHIHYKCKNGLWDVVTPLYVGTKHLGNIFTGQFFYNDDEIDEAFFIKQAEKYGFEKDSYLDALRHIPRYNRETIDHLMSFLVKFTTYISKVSLANIQLEKATEALRVSEQKLTVHLKNTPVGALAWDLNFKATEWNPAAETIFGYSKAEALGKHVTELILSEEMKEMVDGIYRDLISGKGGTRSTNENITKDGRRIICDWYNTILKDANGKVIGVAALVHDITYRKQSEEVLRTSEEEYRSTLNNLLIGVVVHANDTSILFSNPEATNILGLTDEQMSGKKVIDPAWNFIHEDLTILKVEEYPVSIAFSTQKPLYDYVLGINRPDRDYITWVIANAIPVFSNKNELEKIIVNFVDITALKQTEEKLARLNVDLKVKNEELEQVVYVASHDLRSPLVNIDGYSRELEYSIKDLRNTLSEKSLDNVLDELTPILDEEIPEALRFIRTSTTKMETLLAGLLRLSRSGRAALKIESLDMNQIIAKVIASTEFQIKEIGVKVTTGDLPPCQGDAIQMDQVFSNLLDNALKCLDTNRPGMIRISGEVVDDQSVYCVEDNGIGIDVNHMDKIFEIFHQLDPTQNKGEGLGLTIVRKILSRLEGSIRVESTIDLGSRFYVSVPKRKV